MWLGGRVMPPEGYGFWDWLMAEQGVSEYNVGDVIVGEVVEE
jgi:hypothetical protein